MGYPDGVKGYRVRDRTSGAFFNSRDVLFDESGSDLAFDTDTPAPFDFVSDPNGGAAGDTLPSGLDPLLVSGPVAEPAGAAVSRPLTSGPRVSPVIPPHDPSNRLKQPSRLGVQYEVTQAIEKARSAKLSAAWHARHNAIDARVDPVFPPADCPARPASPPVHVFDDDFVNLVCEESACLSIRSDCARNPAVASYDMSIPPATYAEARRRPDFAVWDVVAQKEFHNLSLMGVYRLAALPPGRKTVGSRWVFEFKILEAVNDPRGRLVAQGFSQVPGIDFRKTFAPVAKATSIRLLAAIACHNGWHLECFDATRVFLWGDLEESIYMCQPDGFVPPKDAPLPPGCNDWSEAVWELLKSPYGLKQA